MRQALALCALILAACSPTATTGAATKAEAEDKSEASAQSPPEAPAAERSDAVVMIPPGNYTAVSRTAQSITGDVAYGDTALTFTRGQTYNTQRVGTADLSGVFAEGASTYQSLFGISSGAGVEIRRVTSQQGGQSLCGRNVPVTYFVLAPGRGGDNYPGLWIAAFKGPNAPGAGAVESDLCGTFSYAPGGLN